MNKLKIVERYFKAANNYNEVSDKYRIDVLLDFELLRFYFHDLKAEKYREVDLRIKDLKDKPYIEIIKWYDMMIDFSLGGNE